MYGTATVNGIGSFDVRIELKDNARNGSGADRAGILLSNGYDSGVQTLTATW